MMRHLVPLALALICMIPCAPAQEDSKSALGIRFVNPDLDTTAIQNLPMLQGQRFKPFDSLARERVRHITQDIKFLKCDPVLLYLAILFDGEMIRDARIIHRPSVEVAETLGYTFKSKEDNWRSYSDLGRNLKFRVAVDEARTRDEKKRTNHDEEILRFFGRWATVGVLSGMESRGKEIPFPGFPPREGKVEGRDYSWSGPQSLGSLGWPAGTTSALKAAYDGLAAAYNSGNQEQFDTAAQILTSVIAGLGAPHYPTTALMAKEVAFNSANHFSHARWMYILGSLFSVLFLLLASFTQSRGVHMAKVWLPLAATAFGLFLHAQGLWIRTELSQRAIVGNFYDSMVFVAGACALLGVIFELFFRKGWVILVGGFLAWTTLAFAISNPGTLDPSIKPLMPVLINNSWIHIHVPTIMCSYAALGLTAGLGHLYLVMFLWNDSNRPLMKDMTRFMGLTMPVGVILLFVGMVLGGVWADASWGRFWGFDPKETWSLITWLVFMVLVHGYWAGWLRQFGTAMGTLVGGWALVWTYWGANFYQSGLHSYAGASAERSIPLWLKGFAGFELLVMGAAALVWFARNNKQDPEPPEEAAVAEEPVEMTV